MNVLLTRYLEISVQKRREKQRNKVGGAKEDRGEAKTEVSYSVNSDLQVT